ncbi:peptidoglycan-binding protein [Anaerovorax odorimutans]|uniref:peptidoglycan-binding protein n=1 Tax=Anaerovorax odorimutans TaxID=109327 RepID=UPI00040C2857|nr:peptidoglycan-binding protein [Anaerovorax odorimutans]
MDIKNLDVNKKVVIPRPEVPETIISRPDLPFIPETVTVHLGTPDEPAEEITLSFPDYIKNVASSEIFPTWPESAIRANIYAQTTFTLNRIFTEWYRSRGYDFDITNSTQYDHSFVPNREIFANISNIVDEIFNTYVVRQGRIEPAFTAYCDGVNTKCEGLSQWGTVSLAEQGYTPYEILKNYYGDDINIVTDVPVQANFESYPLYPLRIGSFGQDVSTIQNELNRISQNYPSIPKITQDKEGVFGAETEAAVKEFQRIFNLTVDGIVGSATWYKIKYIYNGVKGLGELVSEGITAEEIESPFDVSWQEGSTGVFVKLIQYYVRVLGCYYDDIPVIEIDGYFGPETTEAVKAIQAKFGILVDGVVGIQTWAELDKAYKNIVNRIPESCLENKTIYPGYILSKGMADNNVTLMQTYLQKISQYYPYIPKVEITGVFDEQTETTVKAVQKEFNVGEVTGLIGSPSWNLISTIYESLPTENTENQ